MRSPRLIAAALVLLTGCGSREQDRNGAAPAPVEPTVNRAAQAPSAPPPSLPPATAAVDATDAGRWTLRSNGEGSTLVFSAAGGGAAIRLFCPAGRDELLVNVPGFRAVGSEERLSFGGGGEAVALVADTRGDRRRGGVSGTGPVPGGFAKLIAGPVSASYGAQSSGPHPSLPRAYYRAFLAACQQAAAAARGPAPPRPLSGSPCRIQDGAFLRTEPLRAVGTEPFWAARIEGRCVTYSHPEDQKGTRIWTRYSPVAGGGGTWTGALKGKRFELKLRLRPGCSDGMSDRKYPLSAQLSVGGESRTGCASPG